MIPLLQDFKTVILASGAFPADEIPLHFLQTASLIVCCDDAAKNLLEFGMEPGFIVGDLDSVSGEICRRFAHVLYHDPDQETNDLTKAVRFCRERGVEGVTILGATGKREDHTLGNLSLLADYSEYIEVQLLTDYGVFNPILKNSRFESFPGQNVSVFSLTPDAPLTFHGLKYPVNRRCFSSWWEGTLNRSLAEEFEIDIEEGRGLVFREYGPDEIRVKFL